MRSLDQHILIRIMSELTIQKSFIMRLTKLFDSISAFTHNGSSRRLDHFRSLEFSSNDGHDERPSRRTFRKQGRR